MFALYFDIGPGDLKAQYGVDVAERPLDARTNIQLAYQVYLRAGWDPWSQTDPGASIPVPSRGDRPLDWPAHQLRS